MTGRVIAIATLALLAALTLAACGSSPPTYSPGPLADSTACGVLTADQDAGDHADITRYVTGANPYLAGDSLQVQTLAEMNVLPGLLGECQSNPAEVLSAAYDKALASSPAVASSTDGDPGSLPPPEQPHAAEKFAAALKTAHASGKLSPDVYAWAARYPQAMLSIGAGVCSEGPGTVANGVDLASARSETAMLLKNQGVAVTAADIVTVTAISLAICPP